MELRAYQQDALVSLDKCVTKGKNNALLCLSTGGGKTLVGVAWLVDSHLKQGKRVLWWAHKKELLDQAEATFKDYCPEIKVTRWNADTKDDSGQVVLAMILSSRNLKGDFGVVCVDESHRIASDSYVKKLESDITYDFLLGLTATPTRLDKKKLPYDTIAYQTSVAELAKKKYLAKPEYIVVRTNQAYKLRMQAGDYSTATLKQLDNIQRNSIVVDDYVKHKAEYGSALAFAVNIEHAETLCKLFISKGVNAEVLHSKNDGNRADVVQRMREGKIDVLVNVQLFTEGIDIPSINTILLCRPTASQMRWSQSVGRGTRPMRPCPICNELMEYRDKVYVCTCGHTTKKPLPNWKETFKIVDYIDDIAKYSLLCSTWVLAELGIECHDEAFGDGAGKETTDRASAKEEAKRIYAELRKHGLHATQADISRYKYDFRGVILWANRFNKDKKEVLNEEGTIAVHKLCTVFDVNTNISTMLDYYPYICPNGEFSLQQWTNLCWAHVHGMTQQTGYLKLIPLTDLKLPDKASSICDITAQIEQANIAIIRNNTDSSKLAITNNIRSVLSEHCPDYKDAITGITFNGKASIHCKYTKRTLPRYALSLIHESVYNTMDCRLILDMVYTEPKVEAIAYADGSADNIKRTGGWATLLYYGDRQETFYGSGRNTTSNRMELMAAIAAVDNAKVSKEGLLNVICDSTYVTINAHNSLPKWVANGWKTAKGKAVANKDLWLRLRKAMQSIHVEFTHTKGHAGNQYNEWCDTVANMARKGEI